MRGMIVAAGLGTRLRPLTELCPKPALPVRGIPLIAYALGLLESAGVSEVIINVHHRADQLIATAERWCPRSISLQFSRERELLHTGGGIRRVADFLRESDPCLILGGDMILDLDLSALVARHRSSGRAATLLLRDDRRADRFGSLGLDAAGRLRRVADRFDLGGETQAGIYTWLNVVSPQAFDSMPEREVFNHLDDWLAPRAAEEGDVGAEIGPGDPVGPLTWIPVGTPAEYLEANFTPFRLRHVRLEDTRAAQAATITEERIVGPGARIPSDCQLRRVVVWADEAVPEGFRGHDGVFAGGDFHAFAPPSQEPGPARVGEGGRA